jgi:acetyl-CoA C-acetyltransferase
VREGITREEMDRFAMNSQNRAVESQADGFFAREIIPIPLPDGRVMTKDDGPRPGTTVAVLATLKPAFGETGRVTAGNACPLNDGAAAAIVMSDSRARELGVTPLARIVSTGLSALAPEYMGLGPIDASRQALKRARMTIDDVDVVEINEAFAAQVIPSARALGVDPFGDRLNPHGGAIALGHPFGMTGVRILCTLLNELRARDQTVGLETMCVGGGMGMAMIVERLS